MSITSIARDTNNNVSLVRMISSDSLATVVSAGYIFGQQKNINALNGGTWEWFMTDMIICSASDGNAIFTFTNSSFSSLQEYSGGSSGIVSPGTAGQLAYYASNGSTVSGISGLPDVAARQVQNQTFSYGPDTGAANAYVLTLTPSLGTYTDGQFIGMTAGHANTGDSTIAVNGHSAVHIFNNDGSTLSSGAILIDGTYEMVYNGNLGGFVLLNSSLSAGGVTAGQVQSLSFNFGVDSGAADAYVVTMTPTVLSLTDGLIIAFKPTHNSTGTVIPTLAVDANPATPIVSLGNGFVGQNDFSTSWVAYLIYSSVANQFTLLTPANAGPSNIDSQTDFNNYAVDSGAANAYVISLQPSLALLGSYIDGMRFVFKATHNNTAASTIAIDGLTAEPILTNPNVALTGGEILAGGTYLIEYNSTASGFILINSSLGGGADFPTNTDITSMTGITGTIAKPTYISDNSANPVLFFQYQGSPVNYLSVTNSSTGTPLNIRANGSDGSIGFLLGNKNGYVGILDFSGTIGGEIRLFDSGGSRYVGIKSETNLPSSASFFMSENGLLPSKTIVVPMSGDTVTLVSTNRVTILNPAGTLATLTVDMPATPVDGQLQTVSSTQIVTSLSVTGGGNTIVGPPTSLSVGHDFSMIYDVGTTTWYPA